MNKNMKDADLKKIIETSWRRRLTAQEQALLATHLAAEPTMRPLWEQEATLNHLLHSLPPATVSSNFTARVLNAARVTPAPHRRGFFLWLPTGWLPRAALAMAMLGCGLLSFHEYQAVARARMAQGAVRVMTSLPSVGWLQDFDTIDRLSKVKVADDDLLTTLE